ncbi:MAG: hypothetical protein ACOYB8_11585 [Eubacteriaceae bacterium]|jgi:hypothetical protein
MKDFKNIDYQFDKLVMLVSQSAQREKDPHDLEYLEWLRSKLEAILVESHQKQIDLDS